MNEVQIFDNEEFGSIRTVTIDGEPWFVGKDVCGVFGDTNYRRSLDRLAEEDKGVSLIHTPGGNQNMTIINESGLYGLIFYMQPQKAKGVSQNDTLVDKRIKKLKKFKRWVTSEVLPAIRKTGRYEAPAAQSTLKASSISEVVAMGKFVKDLLKMQGANAYQIADAVLEVSKEIGFGLSDKFLLPVQLDKVKENKLDMVEFKLAYPESTYQDYIAYRALLKLAEK